MATPSSMLPLGTKAPAFALKEPLTDRTLNLDQLRSPVATLVMFICNHCPYVKHIVDGLVQLGQDYVSKDVSIIAINSNDVEEYPDDGPDQMARLAEKFDFPFLFDELQTVAKAYNATCTPDFFLFDKDMTLAYRGQFDESRPSNSIPVTGEDVRAALDALLAGHPPAEQQKPSIGCNIKWKG